MLGRFRQHRHQSRVQAQHQNRQDRRNSRRHFVHRDGKLPRQPGRHRKRSFTGSLLDFQVTPSLPQPRVYDLCGQTHDLIFDLSIAPTKVLIKELLEIPGNDVCPGLKALSTNVERGFVCEVGEVLNKIRSSEVPRYVWLSTTVAIRGFSQVFFFKVPRVSRRILRRKGRGDVHPLSPGYLPGRAPPGKVQAVSSRNVDPGLRIQD